MTQPAPEEPTTQAIIALESDVLRNLWITQRYHTLSFRLAEAIDPQRPGHPTNINWSTFATWASRTAGRSIRNEEVPPIVREQLGLDVQIERGVAAWIRPVFRSFGLLTRLREATLQTLRDVSVTIADGNRKVFKELAPLFEGFLAAMASNDRAQSVQTFIDALTPGPPSEDEAAGGQDLLKLAFANYLRASAVTGPGHAPSAGEDAPTKEELILLGTCQIGLHEQTRLQPNIKEAMDAPIDTVIIERLGRRLPAVIGRPLAKLVAWLAVPFLKEVTDTWEELVTRHAMTLDLPGGGSLALGNDLNAKAHPFPPLLQTPTYPPLVQLLNSYDKNLSSTAGSGAHNWSNLQNRMGFIVELFRTQQQTTALLEPPFLSAEVSALRLGQVPPSIQAAVVHV